MKELNVYDTLIQKEALINELKGNLFEFLVAKELALENAIEGAFLRSIPLDFQDRLRNYEQWIREHSGPLLAKLPPLARQSALFIKDNLAPKIDGIRLIGKLAGGGQDQRAFETDILLKHQDRIYPLSLKLCKDNSYVNTKSGGVRSFFIKYFSKDFPEVFMAQKLLNQKLDDSYKEVSLELHQLAGLEACPSFAALWRDAGLTELPGQLPPEMNQVLKDHNNLMVQEFYKVWSKLFKAKPQKFLDCMMPLLGFGNKEINQVTCFYKSDYELSYNSLKYFTHYRSLLDNAQLVEPKVGLSSFEMTTDQCIFQLRLKAMNKFTVSGLKVNCSLKDIKS